MREIKFRYIYEGPGKTRFSRTFTLGQIEGGDQFDEISDSPLLKGYRIVGRYEFTGLLDKNGKEIYEGDILQVTANPHHGRGLVCFGLYRLENFTKNDRQKDHLGFHILYGKECLSLAHSQRTPSGYQSSTHSLEVIGNIHQNPELLEDLS